MCILVKSVEKIGQNPEHKMLLLKNSKLHKFDLLDVKLPQEEIIYTDDRQTISSLF